MTYLYTKLPMYQRQGAAALKFNLDNITALMEALGNPHLQVKTLHIAGTNGKGSSAHMLSSVLQEAGYKTGLHTSPHLKSFTERIRINGQAISEQAVVDFVAEHQSLIEKITPSFFEITFAMAMTHFADKKVDIAVIEVGMGGRLDSTNIITPEVSLITNISFDHQRLLGETLEQIASEKAGIIKPSVPVVISQTQSNVAPVFRAKAKEVGAAIVFADELYTTEQAAGNRFNIIAEGQIVHEGIHPDLKGDYQRYNLPGVLKTCDLLNEQGWTITEKAISAGLENVVKNTGLKGRWQQLSTKPLVITDTGHNEEGVRQIVRELEQLDYNNLHIVWGMVNDKEVENILALLPKNAHYYFVRPEIPRGLPAADLYEIAARFSLSGVVYNSIPAGIKAAKQKAEADDCIFIGGSTFVVAEIAEL